VSAGAGRVLVTGARGFIGRHCLARLEARGFEVHAVTSAAFAAPGARWHRCDLLDEAACHALLAAVRPTHLLHLAWIAQPDVFWSSAANLDWLGASVRLVQAFYERGGRRAVGTGSCAEYAGSAAPCREDETPLGPATRYGEAKAAMYFAQRAAARGRGTWAWARIFHPYGAGEPAARFVPSVMEGLARREPVACTHGQQVRDFVHVEDVAEACVALLASEACGAYNVGSGEGRTLREVAEGIAALVGGAALLRFGAREAPQDEPPFVVADITRIGAEAGWAPRIPLEEGLRRTVAERNAERSTQP
jgi:nucleoside-diphosphate-sugar epimerase